MRFHAFLVFYEGHCTKTSCFDIPFKWGHTRHVSAYGFLSFLFPFFFFKFACLFQISFLYLQRLQCDVATHIYFYYPCDKGLGKGAVPRDKKKKKKRFMQEDILTTLSLSNPYCPNNMHYPHHVETVLKSCSMGRLWHCNMKLIQAVIHLLRLHISFSHNRHLKTRYHF